MIIMDYLLIAGLVYVATGVLFAGALLPSVWAGSTRRQKGQASASG